MLRRLLHSKIHRAVVTHCHLDYVGSITIDATLLRAVGMVPNEAVLVADCDNGNRFETYIFEGEADSGVIGVNGAAARLTAPGHRLIICCFAHLDEREIDRHEAKVVVVDELNRITQRLSYPSHLGEPQLTA